MKCAGYRAHGGLGFCFTRSHWLDIYNLANHNKVPPATLLLGKSNLDFSIQLVARKIGVKKPQNFHIKNPKLAWQPAQSFLWMSKLHFCGGCLLVTENAIKGVF